MSEMELHSHTYQVTWKPGQPWETTFSARNQTLTGHALVVVGTINRCISALVARGVPEDQVFVSAETKDLGDDGTEISFSIRGSRRATREEILTARKRHAEEMRQQAAWYRNYAEQLERWSMRDS